MSNKTPRIMDTLQALQQECANNIGADLWRRFQLEGYPHGTITVNRLVHDRYREIYGYALELKESETSYLLALKQQVETNMPDKKAPALRHVQHYEASLVAQGLAQLTDDAVLPIMTPEIYRTNPNPSLILLYGTSATLGVPVYLARTVLFGTDGALPEELTASEMSDPFPTMYRLFQEMTGEEAYMFRAWRTSLWDNVMQHPLFYPKLSKMCNDRYEYAMHYAQNRADLNLTHTIVNGIIEDALVALETIDVGNHEGVRRINALDSLLYYGDGCAITHYVSMVNGCTYTVDHLKEMVAMAPTRWTGPAQDLPSEANVPATLIQTATQTPANSHRYDAVTPSKGEVDTGSVSWSQCAALFPIWVHIAVLNLGSGYRAEFQEMLVGLLENSIKLDGEGVHTYANDAVFCIRYERFKAQNTKVIDYVEVYADVLCGIVEDALAFKPDGYKPSEDYMKAQAWRWLYNEVGEFAVTLYNATNDSTYTGQDLWNATTDALAR